ncbi:hypothetical protein TNCV_3996411 [Trichonephila clavipes]|nr:hypothetical protein TNCV_3996411 [Trichonephila clavipes]
MKDTEEMESGLCKDISRVPRKLVGPVNIQVGVLTGVKYIGTRSLMDVSIVYQLCILMGDNARFHRTVLADDSLRRMQVWRK